MYFVRYRFPYVLPHTLSTHFDPATPPGLPRLRLDFDLDSAVLAPLLRLPLRLHMLHALFLFPFSFVPYAVLFIPFPPLLFLCLFVSFHVFAVRVYRQSQFVSAISDPLLSSRPAISASVLLMCVHHRYNNEHIDKPAARPHARIHQEDAREWQDDEGLVMVMVSVVDPSTPSASHPA
ncbi:hypothetical protein DENSPDRAFT_235642 [Dentipellis sp. KUC8613]|nr:hypothetical protein DENSPDRAFT_235642 [Dentipellis sp. KUC8613]